MSEYQENFSKIHSDSSLHDVTVREQKAKKVISVLQDYLGDLKSLTALDIGCSTGLMTVLYAEKFRNIIGIDIDRPAVEFGIQNNSRTNAQFYVKDGMDTGFEDRAFDVIICNHVYEHVPDCTKLMAEIYRLLKVRGVCYFAACNRLRLIEPHYQLALLSVVPKAVAHIYLRVSNKGTFYYEKHLTLWGLRKLVSHFTLVDYTLKIVRNPEKFHATEMVKPRSLYQKLALTLLGIAFWISPSYVWLLEKSGEGQWHPECGEDFEV